MKTLARSVYLFRTVVPAAFRAWKWGQYTNICGALVRAGPVFVKLGQWMSQREDLFPVEFTQSLEPLLDHTCEHDPLLSIDVLDRDFGFNETFTEFHSEVIGSGSVGQVHKAVLRSTGEEVAVKIIHPGVEECIRTDLYIIKWLWNRIPLLRTARFSDFNEVLEKQTDLRIEAENLQKLRDMYQSECVRFPKPILWSKDILVESLETGLKINDFTREYPGRLIRTRALRLACYMSMAWYHNFLHADMHSGNLLYDIDDDSGKTYVTLLDAGVVAYIEDEEDMRGLMQSIISLEPTTITRFILKYNKNPKANSKRFAEQVRECTDMLKASPPSIMEQMVSRPENVERFFGGNKSLDIEQIKTLTMSMDNTLEFIQRVSKMLYVNSMVVDGNMLCFFLGFAIAYGPRIEGCNLLKEAIRLATREKMCGDSKQMTEWMGCDIRVYIDISDRLEKIAAMFGVSVVE
jgi:predicted unusual protein kinase regulating ubiquinone biosynthesis (AarF/ABC1/UbiB family)